MASDEERRAAAKALTRELLHTIKSKSDAVLESSEDFEHFLVTLMQSLFIATLTIQHALVEDKQRTIKELMTDQFLSGKEAYRLLAERHKDIWNMPPKTEGAK